MRKRKRAPERTFPGHVVSVFMREHGYEMPEQTDITDTEHAIAEDHPWRSCRRRRRRQSANLRKFTVGMRARNYSRRSGRSLAYPLWMILRHGLKGARAGVSPLLAQPYSLPDAHKTHHLDHR